MVELHVAQPPREGARWRRRSASTMRCRVSHENFRQIGDRGRALRRNGPTGIARRPSPIGSTNNETMKDPHPQCGSSGHRQSRRSPVGRDHIGLHGPSLDRRAVPQGGEREIVPYVQAVPGTTPEAYLDLIESRFSNPAKKKKSLRYDPLEWPSTIVSAHRLHPADPAGCRWRRAGPVQGLALVEATWARMCRKGTRADGTAIEPNDPHFLDPGSPPSRRRARDRPRAWAGAAAAP